MAPKKEIFLDSYSEWQNFDSKSAKEYERIFIREKDNFLVVKDLTNEYHVGALIKKNL